MTRTNFELFRQRLEQAKNKPVSSGMNWAKFAEGKTRTFRFLPLKHENFELPIAIFHHHALTFPDGHFESVPCPKDGCPFCKLASDTYRKYTRTENEAYKDAFKKIVAKTHYLLVGYEPDQIDPKALKPEDIQIVRASSKATMDLLESKLSKGVDFVDFEGGRNVEIRKSKSGKNDIATLVWDFLDPEAAFTGKGARDIYDKILELSPDLSVVVNPLSDADMAKKYADFTSSPVVKEDDEEEPVAVKPSMNKSVSAPSTPVASATEKDEVDLDELRALMRDE